MNKLLRFLGLEKEKMYPLGSLRNPEDARDFQLSAVQSPVSIPSKFVTDISVFPVWNQGSTGSCVGQAIAKLIQYYEYKESKKIGDFSPRFIYGLAKKEDNYPLPGTYPRIGAKIAMEKGCATQETLKNDTMLSDYQYQQFELTDAMTKDARPYKVKSYAFVDRTPDALKQAIYQNGAITATIAIDYGALNNGTLMKPINIAGYHYIVIYGYEDIAGDTIFYWLNSWGETWGKGGKGTFKWSDYKNNFYDAIAFVDIINNSMYKYFSQTEVLKWKLVPELWLMLDKAREKAGIPFRIVSGMRTVQQNKNAGGVSNSTHLTGTGVDLACKTSVERWKIINALLAVGFRRLGIYAGHIHADIGKTDDGHTQDVVWFIDED